jgi:hypothetical protein
VSLAKDQAKELFLLKPNADTKTSFPLPHCEKPGLVHWLFRRTYNVSLLYILVVIPSRTALPCDLNEKCQFRLGVTIGRAVGSDTEAWFLIPLQPFHSSHRPYNTTNSRKPIRLHSQAEIQLACDVMQSYGGSGVARSLYFYRTGEVYKQPIRLFDQDQ